MSDWKKKLMRMKKTELVEMIHILEKENHELVNSYNELTAIADEMEQRSLTFINWIIKVTKFKVTDKNKVTMDAIIKHTKKQCKRWK